MKKFLSIFGILFFSTSLLAQDDDSKSMSSPFLNFLYDQTKHPDDFEKDKSVCFYKNANETSAATVKQDVCYSYLNANKKNGGDQCLNRINALAFYDLYFFFKKIHEKFVEDSNAAIHKMQGYFDAIEESPEKDLYPIIKPSFLLSEEEKVQLENAYQKKIKDDNDEKLEIARLEKEEKIRQAKNRRLGIKEKPISKQALHDKIMNEPYSFTYTSSPTDFISLEKNAIKKIISILEEKKNDTLLIIQTYTDAIAFNSQELQKQCGEKTIQEIAEGFKKQRKMNKEKIEAFLESGVDKVAVSTLPGFKSLDEKFTDFFRRYASEVYGSNQIN
jgi:hypothetical protein